jgi:hypothetical protein
MGGLGIGASILEPIKEKKIVQKYNLFGCELPMYTFEKRRRRGIVSGKLID